MPWSNECSINTVTYSVFRSVENYNSYVHIMKYLYLASNDSLRFHPLNSSWDYTVELPQTLLGTWKCALGEIRFSNSLDQDIYVFADICETSLIKDAYLPILRTVKKPGEIITPYFMDMSRTNIQRIRIYLRDSQLHTPEYDIGTVTCTILLQPA